MEAKGYKIDTKTIFDSNTMMDLAEKLEIAEKLEELKHAGNQTGKTWTIMQKTAKKGAAEAAPLCFFATCESPDRLGQ